MKSKYWYIIWILASTIACKSGKSKFDATGVFEATEKIVSAEAAGKILSLNIEEGDPVSAGQVVGQIDGSNLSLQKDQVLSTIEAVADKKNDVTPQTNILQEQIRVQREQIKVLQLQLSTLEKERSRTEKLIKADAAPTKQLDDIESNIKVLKQQIQTANSQIDLLQTQIASQRAIVNIQNKGLMSEQKPLRDRANQIEDFLKKCQITNPLKGIVLVKYAEKDEVTGIGKAIYKVADLDNLILRAYVTDTQLSTFKVGQAVKVFVNSPNGDKEMQGKVTWISEKAEFTPKTIQTKEERANLVYAIKISVKNDGYLKIGMYADVRF